MSFSPDMTLKDALQYALPLWLAGSGELVSQRAGVLNIGIEGMMLSGALAAWAATVASGSPWVGLAAAVGAGVLLAVLFALATLVFDADQVVAGTALNILAVGATGLGFRLCQDAGMTLCNAPFFEPIDLPGVAFDQFGLLYATLVLMVLIHLLVHRTRWGVELTGLGEFPAAAAAAGIRVTARRAACVLFGGATAGLAGSYLSTMFTGQFTENMTAGRGFLALAMVIFGRWQPIGLVAGGLFFGVVYAVENQLEVTPLPGLPAPQLLQMMPYLLSLVVLAGFMGKTRAPSALGRPLERE